MSIEPGEKIQTCLLYTSKKDDGKDPDAGSDGDKDGSDPGDKDPKV